MTKRERQEGDRRDPERRDPDRRDPDRRDMERRDPDRRDPDRRDLDRRDMDRRENQPEDEQQRRPSEAEIQEGESLIALKGILAKVASLLKPLQLTPEESTDLVEQLYGGVLEMDLRLAGESDETRRSSVLAHIQNTAVRRAGDKLVVEYPAGKEAEPEASQD